MVERLVDSHPVPPEDVRSVVIAPVIALVSDATQNADRSTLGDACIGVVSHVHELELLTRHQAAGYVSEQCDAGQTNPLLSPRPCTKELVHGHLAGVVRHTGVDREGHPRVRVAGGHGRLGQRDAVREGDGNEGVAWVV
jgi:hypothetical protein